LSSVRYANLPLGTALDIVRFTVVHVVLSVLGIVAGLGGESPLEGFRAQSPAVLAAPRPVAAPAGT
jgi:hypothetical protein